MNLIPKEKFVNTLVTDLKELRKIVHVLYTKELDLVIESRIKYVYNLNYKMTTETQLFLNDLISKHSSIIGEVKEFKWEVEELLK